MTILKKILFILIILLAFSMPAFAIQTSELTAYLNSQNLTTSGAYAVNGNIGIGSLSPVQKLDVTGTVRATGFTMTGQTPVSGYVLMATDTAGDATWSTAGSVSGWTSTNTTDVYETNSGNVGIGTTITNRAAFTVMNGNVGIGTWVPDVTLDVKGGLIEINNSNGVTYFNGNGYQAYPATGGFMGTNNNTPLVFYANSNNNQLYLATSGNIGISTASPRGLLDVNGTLHPLSPFIIDTNGNVGIGTTITGSAGLSVMNGNVGVGTWVPGAKLDVQGGINFGSGQYLSTGGANIFALFSSPSSHIATIPFSGYPWCLYEDAPSGSNQQMRIYGYPTGASGVDYAALQIVNSNNSLEISADNAAGHILLIPGVTSGNVGIGSLNPGQKLDVTGTVRATGFTMTGQTPVSGYVLMATDTVGDATWSTAGSVSGWTTSGSNMYETTPTNNLGIGTVTPQGAFVVTNGNVGIGTWAPGALLDINGTLQHVYVNSNGNIGIGVTNTVAPIHMYTTNGPMIEFTNPTTGSGSGAYIGMLGGNDLYNVNQTSTGHMYYGTNNVARMAIDQNGNVGIGTALTNGGFSVMNGNVGIGTWAPGGLLDVQGTIQHFYVASNGNVGIGSVVPSQALDVAGVVKSTSYYLYGDQTLSSWGTSLRIASGIGSNYWNNISLWSNGSEQVRLDANGNMGIGTSTPVEKLAVAGGVGIGTNWNDSYLTTVAPNGGMIVEKNVGIGSLAPGQALDVTGTIRTTNFTMTGQTPVSGYVLMATDTAGDATWSTAGSVSGWTTVGSNMYETTPANNVGIGTTTPQGAFVVTNGNVGIGTWAPAYPLDVAGTLGHIYVASSGNMGFGTVPNPSPLYFVTLERDQNSASIFSVANNNATPNGATDARITVQSGSSSFSLDTYPSTNLYGAYSTFAANTAMIFDAFASNGTITFRTNNYTPRMFISSNGNVGINDNSPQGTLDVEGTSAPIVFNTLSTATYNVGIGTTTPQGAFVVTNGNVGIGTWVPNAALSVMNGFVGIGTVSPGTALGVIGNVGIGSSSANGGIKLQVNTTPQSLDGMSVKSYIENHYISIMPSMSQGAFNGLVRAGDQAIIYTNGNAANTGNLVLAPWAAGSGGIRMDSNGNVGVAVINPAGALDVEGTLPIVFDSTSTSTGNVGVGTTTPQGSFVVTNGNVGIGTWAPGSEVIVKGGNVGIGTSSASVPLSIQSVGAVTQESALMISNPNTTSYATTNLLFSANGFKNAEIQGQEYSTTSGGILGFDTTNTSGTYVERMRMDQNGNVGIGTSVTFYTGLAIMNGNVGIGTYLGVNGELVVDGGNVGIGSNAPGQVLDVTGTVRATGFTMTGQTPVSGYVLMATDTAGDATWSTAGSVSGWTTVGSKMYETTPANNVGIGTTTPQGAFVVTNGNVGIGTWVPGGILDVQGTLQHFYLTSAGNVGVGVSSPNTAFEIRSGDIRTGSYGAGNNYGIQFTPSGGQSAFWQGDIAGTLEIGNGLTTGTTPWLSINNAGNVGIGTATPQGGLVVMNGNVGIGTWVPGEPVTIAPPVVDTGIAVLDTGVATTGVLLAANATRGHLQLYNNGIDVIDLNGNPGANSYLNLSTGNLGVGTITPQGAFVVTNGNVGVGTWAPAAALDIAGAMYTHTVTNGALTINWAAGNVQSTSSSCGAMTFTNMQDGGSYTLTVEGTTSGTCTFTEAGLTFKTPPSYGATTTGTMTLFQFVRRGTNVFVTWQTGY